MPAAKTEEFVGKLLADLSAAFVAPLVAIGDRLGLFKDLAVNGPATSGELAARLSISERYAREWLGAMASAGYLRYDPPTRRFTLPAEHAPPLAHEGGPVFFGGAYQMWASFVRLLDELAQAFREGGGIPQAAYDRGVREGMERLSRGYVENWLAQEWIPAMPDVRAKLEQGADVADVGCGRAGATIKLAELYPPSRFTGYDAFGPTIDEAKGRAHAAGVSGRVAFDQRDAARGLPSTYDVITTFDVVHDSPDPPGLLRSIRRGLKDEGIYVCVDANCSAKLEDNAGPLGSLYYGFSLLYCMTTSLAAGGAGLGTLGFHEENVRALCAEAGFGSVRRVPIQSPLHSLYEIRP